MAPLSDQPLYDGVGFPDEPYRWVVAPPGAAPAPTPDGATATVVLEGGTNPQTVTVLTAEQGPQAVLVLPPGTVRAGSGSLVVTLEPSAGPTAVAGGRARSNSYAVLLRPEGAGRADLARGALAQLRVPSDVGPPVAVLIDQGDGWRALRTRRTGADVYTAELPGVGRVAAVTVTDETLLERYAAPRRSGRLVTGVLVLGLVLVGCVLLLVRQRRDRGGDAGHASNTSA